MLKDEIQNTVTNSIASLKRQKDQLLYNRLYDEYKASNLKYSKLFNASLTLMDNDKTKKTGKTIEAQIQKEQEQIQSLLEKMQQFSELHKEKEKSIEQDAKIIQTVQDLQKYTMLDTTLNNISSEINALTREEANRHISLADTQKKIRKLEALVPAQLSVITRLKTENAKREDALKNLQKAAQEHIKSKQGNTVEAQEELKKINTQLTIQTTQHNDELKVPMQTYEASKYSLGLAQYEATIMELEKDQKLKAYQNKIVQLNTPVKTLTEQKVNLEKKLGLVTAPLPSKSPTNSVQKVPNAISPAVTKIVATLKSSWVSRITPAASAISNIVRNRSL